jgi:hypothetical protein
MYPTLEQLLEAPDKDRMLEVHRSLRSNLPGIALLLASTAFVFAINLSAWQASEGAPQDASYLTYFGSLLLSTGIPPTGLRWLGIVPAIILLELFRRFNDDLYVFALESATHYEGRLSLSSSVPSVKYEDIKAITVEQNLVGRLFDFGNILLDTPAQDGVELTVSGVRSPLRLAMLIEEMRENAIRQHRSEADDRAEERRVAPAEG